jgi:MFS family permease
VRIYYSTIIIFSSFIFGRLADLHHLHTVILGGFGFAVAAFFLQIFATYSSSLMFSRDLTGFSVGIHLGL